MKLLEARQDFMKKHPLVGVLSDARSQASAHLEKSNFPTRKDEEWKYTPVAHLKDLDFVLPAVHKALPEDVKDLPFDCFRLTFVNGSLVNTKDSLPPGLSLSVVTDKADVEVTKLLKEFAELKSAHPHDNHFSLLNQIYAGQIYVLKIAEKCDLKKPLLLDFYSESTFVSPRIYLEAGSHASAAIFERWNGYTSGFDCAHVDVLLRPESSLRFFRLAKLDNERSLIGRNNFYLKRSSSLNVLSATLGGKLNRHELDIFMQEEGASTLSRGLYLCEMEQTQDHHVLIDHQAGHCQSDQLYKGILNDSSRAIFNGKVRIGTNCIGANSNQLNKSLVLSTSAEIDSKPELEIATDEVKATHGSTVGRLDEEEIFYFQSRGIKTEKAIELLKLGFIAEVLQSVINEDVQEFFAQEIKTALGSSL